MLRSKLPLFPYSRGRPVINPMAYIPIIRIAYLSWDDPGTHVEGVAPFFKVSPTRSLSAASRNSMKNSTKKLSRFGRKSSFLVEISAGYVDFLSGFIRCTILLMEEILHHLGCVKPCK